MAVKRGGLGRFDEALRKVDPALNSWIEDLFEGRNQEAEVALNFVGSQVEVVV